MKRILTAKEMKECDRRTIRGGVPSRVLMERAASAVADVIFSEFPPSKVLVVCGSGNNGGDGFLTARFLSEKGYLCHIWYVGEGHTMSQETEDLYEEMSEAGFEFTEYPQIGEYDLVVDAILGTGISFPAQGLIKDAIDVINASETPVVSVDIPSGICADTGKALGSAINADYTVVIQTYKRGHLLCDGINASGHTVVADIGIAVDEESLNGKNVPFALDELDICTIPKRNKNAHKGDFGRVLVVAGSEGMSGAAYLSAFAAYRCGAGIVEVFTPESNRQIIQTLLPEAIVTSYDALFFDSRVLSAALDRSSVVVVGPGLGMSECSQKIVYEVFKNSPSPIIADADALNIKAKCEIDFPKDVPVIITPHPGELSRLTRLSIKEISADPWKICTDYAIDNDIICVSKSSKTVISDGADTFINTSGGPSMAKGGSGDVLTGVIAGMLCCDLAPIRAAALGAYIHGLAGDISAEKLGEISPMARDIIDSIPYVLKRKEVLL